MKLGKISWIILSVGIVMVAFASLGIARAQQVREHEQLQEEISITETRLAKYQLKELHVRQSDLEEQLNQATSNLKAAKDNLRQPIESIGVTGSLFQIAESCGVEITGISSSGIASDKLTGITCATIRLAIDVEGDVPNLISYVIKLNNDFTTGVVMSVQSNPQEMTEEETEGEQTGEEVEGEPGEEEEAEKPSAHIQLAIYTYQGD
ncbi:hypothetical protein ACFLUZ_06760 [Chloroflexota bacterium]